jgi:YVTN family beta-propeller protein
MIQIIFSLLLALALLGCTSTPTPAPPILAVASASPAHQPTVPVASPSATLAAPTESPLPQPTLTAPAVLGRFNLVSLPGVGRAPTALALLGDALYVANRESDNVAVIRDRKVRSFIPTAAGPTALLADTANSRVYVATYVTPTISIIANDGVVRTAELGEAGQSLAIAGDNLLVGLGSSATIEIRDPSTLAKKGELKLKEGYDVLLMAVDAPRHRLYANAYGWVVVLDLDTLTELSSFEAPYIFGSLAVDPRDGTIWAGMFDDKQSIGYLVAYDESGKTLKSVRLGPDLRGAAVDSSGRVFVTNSYSNQVAAVDGAAGSILATIDVGVDPTSLVLDDANHLLYAASESSDNVSVIDTSSLKVVGLIPVGMDISALLANEELERVYAASASTDSVFVIENGQVVGEIGVGHHPVDLARDPNTNRLFVANYASGDVTVIDEVKLTVQSTVAITRSLPTVAVDPVTNRLFAGSTVLSLDKLQPEEVYLTKGPGLFGPNAAEYVRANANLHKLYVFADNGIPGSNSRTILYTFSEDKLAESKILEYRNGGNITALAIDPSNQRVYGTATHPLGYTNALEVWDGDDNHLNELALSSRTSGMVVNPQTNHLFLAHSFTYEPYPGVLNKRDNAVQILDTRTLGEVGWLDVPGGPGVMALLGNTVYVAGHDDGAITLIGDVTTREATAPTSTYTPSPYPTSTSTPAPAAARPSTVAPSVTPLACEIPIAQFAQQLWTPALASRLGCPLERERLAQFAAQQYEHGEMYYRDDIKHIYVLFEDGTWVGFDDTWDSTQPSDSCPNVSAGGLIKPIRGFGKIWCDQPGLRDKIGGGRSDEIGLYKAYAQSYQHGLMFGPSNSDQLRINHVFVLLDDGSWQ